jgi:protein gp37
MNIPKSTAQQMTGIQWTDFTGNPWTGCTRIIANSGARSGCDICYAAFFAKNRMAQDWGPGVARIPRETFHTRMRRLDKLAQVTGYPFSVFSLSLGDWLDPEVDPTLRSRMVDTVEACPNLTWLLLTHRPHLARKLLPGWSTDLPANVWPGVTVDHPLHGYRWDQLRAVWGATGRAWVSAEPLAASLATLDLSDAAVTIYGGASNTDDPSWEFNPDWVTEAVDRYGEDRVFFKQFGNFVGGQRVGKKAAGRAIEGRVYDHTPWPRHREMLTQIARGP